MERTTKRALSFSALIGAAVVFGMVVAGSVNVTPRSEAQREATPAARPRGGGVLLPSFADTAQEAMPSVVSITSTDIVKGNRGRRYQNPFGEGDPFEFFFGPPGGGGPNRRGQRPDDEEHKEVQGGTGFIISEDGYVVTNNHVIEGADKIEVRINNKEKYPAKLVGKDPATDLALLKIEVKQRLTPLPLGDSDRVRVGEWVMAIGDPLNFDKTVTVGVVSAKDRSGLTADAATRSFENYIQTDAAINFGNSGGPLLNTNGEVVGINTAIFRPAQNIGFAVPINTLKTILPQLRDKGKVVRGFLGINIVNVDADRAAAFDLKAQEGAFVESVEAGKPAEKAGVRPGDTIVKVDSVPVKDTRDLIGYVSSKTPGSKVQLGLVRDGRDTTVTATLAERKDEPTDEGETDNLASDDTPGKIGMTVQELTPQLRQMQRVKTGVEGLLVVRVKEVSPAADAQIQEGDVITSVNGEKVTTTDEFGKIVGKAKKGDYLKLYIYSPRGDISRFALVKIED
jgi:serine protease Do